MEYTGMTNETPCPITPKESEALIKTVEKIDKRLCQIEKTLYAGRVALYMMFCIAAAVGWVAEHIESIRQGVANWLKP